MKNKKIQKPNKLTWRMKTIKNTHNMPISNIPIKVSKVLSASLLDKPSKRSCICQKNRFEAKTMGRAMRHHPRNKGVGRRMIQR